MARRSASSSANTKVAAKVPIPVGEDGVLKPRGPASLPEYPDPAVSRHVSPGRKNGRVRPALATAHDRLAQAGSRVLTELTCSRTHAPHAERRASAGRDV